MYEDLQKESAVIDLDFKETAARIQKDPSLSEAGKRDRIAAADQVRRQKVAELQDRARRRLEVDRKKVAIALAGEREANVERLRETLGDVAAAALYEKRLSRMSSKQIAEAYQEAAGDWEKTIVGEYGRLIISDRLESSSKSPEDYLAYSAVEAKPDTIAKLEVFKRELDQGDEWVENLDQVVYRQHTADVLNVAPNFIPTQG